MDSYKVIIEIRFCTSKFEHNATSVPFIWDMPLPKKRDIIDTSQFNFKFRDEEGRRAIDGNLFSYCYKEYDFENKALLLFFGDWNE